MQGCPAERAVPLVANLAQHGGLRVLALNADVAIPAPDLKRRPDVDGDGGTESDQTKDEKAREDDNEDNEARWWSCRRRQAIVSVPVSSPLSQPNLGSLFCGRCKASNTGETAGTPKVPTAVGVRGSVGNERFRQSRGCHQLATMTDRVGNRNQIDDSVAKPACTNTVEESTTANSRQQKERRFKTAAKDRRENDTIQALRWAWGRGYEVLRSIVYRGSTGLVPTKGHDRFCLTCLLLGVVDCTRQRLRHDNSSLLERYATDTGGAGSHGGGVLAGVAERNWCCTADKL